MVPKIFDRRVDPNDISAKSEDIRYLTLKNKIHFDREKGRLLISPCLYIREKKQKKYSDLIDVLLKKIDEFVNRYQEWQAKEWFVEFVDKNFEKNKKTIDLINSVKNNGRVSSSDFLKVFIEKEHRILSSSGDINLDGSLRSRYSVEDKKKIINKIIFDDFSDKGFCDDEIEAFLNYFYFGDASWVPGSFDNVVKFLNHYAVLDKSDFSVFGINSLNKKVEEMQKKAKDFQLRQEQNLKIKARGRSILIGDGNDEINCSRKDLYEVLEERWCCSCPPINSDVLKGSAVGNYLKIDFLRYLKESVKNPDEKFLKNLIYFPQAVQAMPLLYGFPEDIKNPELKKMFELVVDELRELGRQAKVDESKNFEFDNDLMKRIMGNILAKYSLRNKNLNLVSFPGMMKYVNFGVREITDENVKLFEEAATVNIEEVAIIMKFSEVEIQIFNKFIEKLKNDLRGAKSALNL